MNALLLHADSLNNCYVACKSVMTTYGKFKEELFIIILMEITSFQKKHSNTLKQLHGDFKKGDLLGVLKGVNAFLENKDVKEMIVKVLGKVKTMYQKSYKDVINEMLDCYFAQCNDEAIDITYQFALLGKNILALIDDKEITKLGDEISKLIHENMVYARLRLEAEVAKRKEGEKSAKGKKAKK